MLINDPDSFVRSSTLLNLGVDGNIWIDTAAKTIEIDLFGDLSNDGATLKSIYSYLKEEWKNDAALIAFPFPMVPITDEQFEFVNGWNFANNATRYLVRSGGWAVKDAGGVSLEEWAGVITLGSIGALDQVYFQQEIDGSSVNVQLTGAVNQAIKVYGDINNGNFDHRGYLNLYVREQAKTYASSSLADIGVSTLTYQAYRFPLANADDIKVTETDLVVDAYGVTITWYATPQSIAMGSSNYNFNVLINGNNKTAEEIYMAVQSALRKNSDIDAGPGTVTGKTANALLRFVGDTLYTQMDGANGVAITNFQANDTNRLVFTDNTGAERTYPFVASITIQFGTNLINDPSAKFWMFFTNDDAGDNTGRDYGTENAILVKNDQGVDITGLVSGNSSLSFSFDYDGNIQRGAASAGANVPITVVAIGLDTAQFVVATGTIGRSIANSISLVANLERNYENAI